MRRIPLLLGLAVLLLEAGPLRAQTPGAANTEVHRGVLKGRFVYDGEPPPPTDQPGATDYAKLKLGQPLPRYNGRVLGAHLGYMEYLQNGIRPRLTDESLLVSGDRGIANVFVYLSSPDVPWSRPKSEKAGEVRIRIHDGQFVLRAVGMTMDQALVVENADPVLFPFRLHAIRTDSIHRGIAPRSEILIEFSKSEQMPSKMGSGVMGWVQGALLIHSNPYFAVSAADGTFSIPGLPPGEWEFTAWHERTGYVRSQTWPKGRFRQTIASGTSDLGTVTLAPTFFDRK